MTRISRKHINEKTIAKLNRLLFEIFYWSDNQEDFLSLLNGILSQTEKIMIAKRIGIIYLLIKKVDTQTIADTLKVSTATVYFHANILGEKQAKITNTIIKMLKKEKVLNFLDDFFADIMIHPGLYIGHHKLKWEHEKKKEQRKTLPI